MKPRFSPYPFLFLIIQLIAPANARPMAGREGASFLNIQPGGRPAALGGAYNALASDVYAPLSNPGGLGFLETPQFAVMHLSYFGDISYEFGGLVHPIRGGLALGVGVQNFRPGRTPSRDQAGASLGSFSGDFYAVTLGFGQAFGPKFSMGAAGKAIRTNIGRSGAGGYAGDFGVMVHPSQRAGFSAVLANVGPKLAFNEAGDSLPSALRLGGYYGPFGKFTLVLQGERSRTEVNTGRAGLEWNPSGFLSLRGGYRTGTSRDASSEARVTAGLGIHLGGQDFDYAWAPLGEFGNTQYFSMVIKWGKEKSRSEEEEPPVVFKESAGERKDRGGAEFYKEDLNMGPLPGGPRRD